MCVVISYTLTRWIVTAVLDKQPANIINGAVVHVNVNGVSQYAPRLMFIVNGFDGICCEMMDPVDSLL